MPILVPSIAVLIPILTLPFWLFYFDVTPKVVALLMGAAIACMMAPLNARALGMVWRRTNGKRIIMLITTLGVVLVVSTIFSTRPALSFGGSNWRSYGLVTQLALLVFTLLTASSIVSGAVRIGTVLRAVTISGAFVAFYAILQYLGWDPLLPSATYHIGEGQWTIVRPPGTIGHADYLGTYLVFVMFFAGSVAVAGERNWRIAGIICVSLSAFAIVLSGTRSAILAAMFGAVLLLFRFRPSIWKAAAALVVALAALTAFYYSPMGLKLRGRTRWYLEDPAGGARLMLWRDSLNLAVNRPVMGWGPETFGANFPRYQSLELARAFPDFYHESPHNIFLDELTDQGLAGLGLFLAWTGFAARSAWRLLRQKPQHALIATAMLAGLLSLQFNAFVLTTAFYFFLASVLVLLVGEPLTEVATSPTSRMHLAAALAVGLPLAALFAIFAVRLCVADAAMAMVRTRLEARDVLGAASRYETVRRWEPRAGSSDSYYSRNMAAIVKRQREVYPAVKAWQEAIQAGIRATKSAEDTQNAFYDLASIYAQADNRKDAERALHSSIEYAPNWFKPHWVLARLLQASGRKQEALEEARTAADRDGGKHSEVADTLRQLQQH